MLSLKNIVKNYIAGETEVQALKGLNLNFRKSEFVSILGPSGCGKTTTLNIIGGLDKYTSGDLVIDNVSTKNFKDKDWDTYRNHKIGFIFQSYNLISHLSVLKNVEITLSMSSFNKKERTRKAIEVLTKLGLKDQIYKKPNQLSGGQMQRVAIARAIVNDPEIILADEPTGALDTKTSIQIMKILKKISKKKLVIMVTHNSELANEYSTRIISLLDGKMIKDTNPYKDKDFEKDENKLHSKTTKHTKSFVKQKSSMKYKDAIGLSFKNLLTKKTRTLLTSFAGSIGILGIALVLAISNGFTNYINTLQSDTLAGYPISVPTAVVDFSSFTNKPKDEQGKEEVNYIVPYGSQMEQYAGYGHYNYLGQEFISKVKDFEKENIKPNQDNDIAAIQYNYYLPLNLISKDINNNYSIYNSTNTISILSGNGAGYFFEEIPKQFLESEFDIVSQSQDYNENDPYGLTLIVGNGNKISFQILNILGFNIETSITYEPVQYEKIFEKQIAVINNNDYYLTFDESTAKCTTLTNNDTTKLQNLFNNTSTTKLHVNRIIRKKADSSFQLLSNGFMYSNEFAKEYLENCKNSEIVSKQEQLKTKFDNDIFFYQQFYIRIDGIGIEIPAKSTKEIQQYLKGTFKYEITEEEAYQLGLQMIGASELPQTVIFYPNNFTGKTAITNMIDDYNKTASDAHKIVYSDTSNTLLSMLSNLIDIISYVLIAFAGVSLVVSSIMISIIIYVSVIERTKEIGVLRSIGARKKDISRVFNAEALIIGFTAGLLGIGLAYLLSLPINLIVSNLANGISNIAFLNPIHALILIGISMLLTFISGLIPAKIASNKDPVLCLRTE
ncbi:MAG: ABC transporter ATP-binding protein/permease [Clostridiales bacterium]|nr:ABC transporter ATP-binding protein/permease [Candidatus Apopatousia equi]